MSREPDSAVRCIANQTAGLAHVHDHITRVIRDLTIPEEAFSDQYNSRRTDHPFQGVVKMFLYQHAREFNDSELASRLDGVAYVFLRFNLDGPPTQAGINYMWRNRLTRQDRRRIEDAADHIRTICAYHDLVHDYEPAVEVDDLTGHENLRNEQIMEAVERASDTVFTEFDTKRADNAKYSDEVFFERQGYLNMSETGTTTPRRRFARLSNREEVPHGRTHLRTLKKTASPDPQVELDAFRRGDREPDWKRIRDEVLEPFHRGIGEVLEEARTGKDGAGIREPVIAAIDVTQWGFHGSPLRPHGEMQDEDQMIRRNGEWRYVRHEFPEMVSGSHKEDHPRAFKFATLTIIAGDTPFILAIEPVREDSWWEDADTPRRAEIVDRLLEQACQHVDIYKVFMDAAFHAGGVQNVVNQRDITYLIPKSSRNKGDKWAIKTVDEKPGDGSGSKRESEFEDSETGETHTGSVLYQPSRQADGEYAVFVTNRDVDAGMVPGLVKQYDQRWEIENQYKAIKNNFLPQCASLDYRVRFLYFVLGCVMHNVWRLANYYLRDVIAAEAHLGETPPIPAGEIVEILGFALDPGG